MTETTRPYALCEKVWCCATVKCCFFSANLAEDVQLAATLTPDDPVQLIIDFVTPKINPFLSHLLSLSLPPPGPIIPSTQSPIKK
jgi:hypothetical protein